MVFPVKTCKFLGVIDVPIKTYTTTYSNIVNPWHWEDRNIEPIEFISFSDVATSWKGSKGNIFTRDHITPFVIGDTSSGGSIQGTCAWYNDTLLVMGTRVSDTGHAEPFGQKFDMVRDGVGISPPLFPTNLKVLPNFSNTTSPSPWLSWGGVTAFPSSPTTLGIHYSYRIDLVDVSAIWDGTNNFQSHTPSDLNGSTQSLSSLRPTVGGYNNVYVGASSNALDAVYYTQKNFAGPSVFYSITFEEPPTSTVVINNIMHNSGFRAAIRPCKYGFIVVDPEIATIDGISMIGFAVLAMPDFSGYYILKIRGTDSGTNTWTTAYSGTIHIAMGSDGDIFLHPANNNAVVLISGSPLILPQFNATFAALSDPTFVDWKSTDNVGAAYSSYFQSQQALADPQFRTNAPYVYTFMQNGGTVNSDGAKLKILWDWTTASDTLRVTPAEQTYNYLNNELISVRKTRVRGRGRALDIRYDSDGQKDFNIKGWVIFYETNEGQ